MKIIYLIFTLFVFHASFSQNNKEVIIGSFDNSKYILNCPAFKYSYKNNDYTKSLDILNHNNIELVKDEYIKVQSEINKYILEKTSEYFFKQLEFYSIEIVQEDKIENFKNRIPKVDMSECKAKYSIYFYFKPILNVKYCVGFALDKDLKILNKDNFPNGEILPFEYITYSDLMEMGVQYLKTKVENLNLKIIDNKFYWSIDELVDYKQGKNIVNRVYINVNDLKQFYIKKNEIYVDF